MKSTDICFYMSITKEENSSLLIAESANQNIPDEDLTLTGQLTRKLSFRRGSFNIGNNKTTSTTTSETKPMIKRESNTNSVKTHSTNSTKHKHNEIRINIEDMSTESPTTANCTSTNQNQNLSPNQDLKEIDEVAEVQTQSSQEKE